MARHIGEAVDCATAAELGAPDKGNTPVARGQAVSRNQFHMAQGVLRKWGKPVVFSAGQFWTFDIKSGWSVCSSALFNLAARLSGKNPRHVVEIMQQSRALPSVGSHESCYWEQFLKDNGDVEYKPLLLSSRHLLFTDQILDLLDPDMSTSLVGRVVFGPMISLEYGLDEESEEPKCQEFEQLLVHCFPDAEIRRHFLESIAGGLQPHVGFRGQIVIWGKAHCGKTTLATAIGCCPNGRTGLSQMQEEELVRDKFTTTGLVNRFYNVSDDSARTSRWPSWLKRYTSGSMIVEPKFHMPETVCPTAMLVSTCNELQQLIDSSGAAVDRMFAFHLVNPLPRNPGGDESMKMDARHWSTPARRAGVLSVLVPALVDLRSRGRFDPPRAWVVEMDKAAGEADPVAALLVETFKAEPDGFIETATLVEALVATGLEESKLVRMIGNYVDRLFGARRDKKKVSGQTVRGYSGMALIDGGGVAE